MCGPFGNSAAYPNSGSVPNPNRAAIASAFSFTVSFLLIPFDITPLRAKITAYVPVL
ncbi:MAG: hypothetical protein ACSLEN_13385 [Candidatus Malihini olakiniferum]